MKLSLVIHELNCASELWKTCFQRHEEERRFLKESWVLPGARKGLREFPGIYALLAEFLGDIISVHSILIQNI